jgi:hypothetical protein
LTLVLEARRGGVMTNVLGKYLTGGASAASGRHHVQIFHHLIITMTYEIRTQNGAVCI